MANLTSQQIKDSYQSLITTSDVTSDPTTGVIQNGKGTPFTDLSINGTFSALLFAGSGANLASLRVPAIRARWITGYYNLANGVWNNCYFDSVDGISQGGYGSTVLSISNVGTPDASIMIDEDGLYVVITEAHFFDLFNNIDFRVGLFTSTNPTSGFALLRATSDYKSAELTADQIVTGVTMISVTGTTYVQMRVNPSINTPFPSNTDNAPTAMTVIKIT
jgi:hypothetical protein